MLSVDQVLDEIYLRDEDAIVFTLKQDFNSKVRLLCFSELSFDGAGIVIPIGELPTCKYLPRDNELVVGTADWAIQSLINCISTSMVRHNVYNWDNPPYIELIGNDLKLVLPEEFKNYTFNKVTLDAIIQDSFPNTLQDFCKEVCLQEPKYALNKFTGPLNRTTVTLLFCDITFKRSVLLGSVIQEYEKTFDMLFSKFIKHTQPQKDGQEL